jgi:hypothetical protein
VHDPFGERTQGWRGSCRSGGHIDRQGLATGSGRVTGNGRPDDPQRPVSGSHRAVGGGLSVDRQGLATGSGRAALPAVAVAAPRRSPGRPAVTTGDPTTAPTASAPGSAELADPYRPTLEALYGWSCWGRARLRPAVAPQGHRGPPRCLPSVAALEPAVGSWPGLRPRASASRYSTVPCRPTGAAGSMQAQWNGGPGLSYAPRRTLSDCPSPRRRVLRRAPHIRSGWPAPPRPARQRPVGEERLDGLAPEGGRRLASRNRSGSHAYIRHETYFHQSHDASWRTGCTANW